MNLVFFGTSSFGIPALEVLKRDHSLLAVVTTPDKPGGRHLKSRPCPVKEWSRTREVRYLDYLKEQPMACLEVLKGMPADVYVVASFGALLKSEVLTLPRRCPLNIHASLLPKYRGASPMQAALLSGDAETGVTIMRMIERLDAGDALLQKRTAIAAEDTISTLERRLSELGAEAILEALDALERDRAKFTVQDDRMASYAPKITKNDGKIDWKLPSRQIARHVRAYWGWPGTFFFVKGKRLTLSQCRELPGKASASPGTVLLADPKEGLRVACGQDSVLGLEALQAEGKKTLPWSEFCRGFSLKNGDILE